MSDYEWERRPLLLSEREELRRKGAHHVAVERHIVRSPEPVEDREKQQRVFQGSPSASVCSISKRARSAAALVSGAACPLTCMEWINERDL